MAALNVNPLLQTASVQRGNANPANTANASQSMQADPAQEQPSFSQAMKSAKDSAQAANRQTNASTQTARKPDTPDAKPAATANTEGSAAKEVVQPTEPPAVAQAIEATQAGDAAPSKPVDQMLDELRQSLGGSETKSTSDGAKTAEDKPEDVAEIAPVDPAATAAAMAGAAAIALANAASMTSAASMTKTASPANATSLTNATSTADTAATANAAPPANATSTVGATVAANAASTANTATMLSANTAATTAAPVVATPETTAVPTLATAPIATTSLKSSRPTSSPSGELVSDDTGKRETGLAAQASMNKDTRNPSVEINAIAATASSAGKNSEIVSTSTMADAQTATDSSLGSSNGTSNAPFASQLDQARQALAANGRSVDGANRAAEHAIATPVATRGWSDEVGQRLSWVAQHDNGRADLVLNPAHLGRVEVTINMNGDQATAAFVATNPAAREALQDAMPRLREVLNQAGIQLGQASVSSGNGGQAQSDQRPAGPAFVTMPSLSSNTDLPLSGTRGLGSNSGNGLIDTFA